ncbi:hypothetical protein [Uliginosibacterium gangwonense]|uniref:hypothetical protein n=1 Tax=Uliginosibacterium gangwonense TaxID=392736 RepID=UPI000380EB8C|nr:hypothetical protein [Uliginosibacterium gangwonense]
MFLKSTEGSYEPAFFIIRIEADEPPEQLAKENESTFIHEYLHLLQDLILPYCMRENTVLLEIFMSKIENARERGQIHLPNDYSNEDISLATKINQTTWGDCSFCDNVEKINRIELQEAAIEGKNYKLHKYLLQGIGIIDYHFGARDFLEYIASKIEARHFPSDNKLPDLPYRTVDLVIEHEGLGYLSDVKRIALAEYCLLNDNPARRLMVVIGDIKSRILEGVEFADDDEFIDFILQLEWLAQDIPFRTIAEKIAQRYAQFQETLERLFPENAFPLIYAWLSETLRSTQELIAGRGLFSALYQMNTDQFRETMNLLLSRLGVPLIVNGSEQLGTSIGDDSSKSQFIQMLIVYQFSEYIKNDTTSCPLYSTCEGDTPELINSDCIDAPFRRASNKELCPFGLFVKTMGLSTVTWYKRGRLIPGWQSSPFGLGQR